MPCVEKNNVFVFLYTFMYDFVPGTFFNSPLNWKKTLLTFHLFSGYVSTLALPGTLCAFSS